MLAAKGGELLREDRHSGKISFSDLFYHAYALLLFKKSTVALPTIQKEDLAIQVVQLQMEQLKGNQS